MQARRWLGLFASIALAAAGACADDGAQPIGTTAATSGTGAAGGTTSVNTTSVGANMQMAGGGGSTSTSSGGSPPGYPLGPYGNEVGQTFPFLSWEGYLSTNATALATAETWTDTYTSLDLHGSGAQYALIHTTLSG